MKQIGQFCVALLALYGLYKLLLELLDQASSSAPQTAPVINVTVNMPEKGQTELKAGDHVKGLAKIAWNKACEKVVAPI